MKCYGKANSVGWCDSEEENAMLKLEKAKGQDHSDGKRLLVFKNGVQIGAICIIDDDNAWHFRISTTKDLTQGQPLVDLTGEELKNLYDAVDTKTIP